MKVSRCGSAGHLQGPPPWPAGTRDRRGMARGVVSCPETRLSDGRLRFNERQPVSTAD